MNKQMTLLELYGDEIPDKDELLWEFIDRDDLDVEFPLIAVNPVKWFIEPDGGDNIPKEIYNNYAEPEQQAIVEHFRNQIKAGVKLRPVVFNDDILVDGYHRMTAMALENQTTFEAIQLIS